MNKYFLICFCLFTVSLSFYRPLSKLNINYPSDICYFKDTTTSSAILNLEFVRGCAKNKICTQVDTSDSYEIHTCQNSGSLAKGNCDACSNQFECDVSTTPSITCSDDGKCDSGSGCEPVDPPSPDACETGKIKNILTNNCVSENKIYCETYNSPGAVGDKTGTYSEDNYFKICGKSNIEKYTDDRHYYRKNIEWVYYGSVEDGNFVEKVEACKSGYALYFYGNKQLENPLDDSHEMFLLCVTVLDVELESTMGATNQKKCKRIKYKIGTEKELIYDTSNLDTGYTLSNCDYLLMTKLELFKKYKEEYDKVKDQCYSSKSSNNLCGKDELMKWWYLYENPRNYLLYKDQKEVLDYLIHGRYPEYTPETGKVPETTPVTEPPAITEDETTTEPETESTESSKFLNIKYFIFLLFGLFEL